MVTTSSIFPGKSINVVFPGNRDGDGGACCCLCFFVVVVVVLGRSLNGVVYDAFYAFKLVIMLSIVGIRFGLIFS